MSIDQNHFALFGLETHFALDAARLDDAYRAVQGRVHPDRFAASDGAAQRVALQWATRANEAYQVLRDPVQRARYLCELRGIDLGMETDTAMSPQFLGEQMEWREALDEAREERSIAALEALAARLQVRRAADLARVSTLLDGPLNGASTAPGGVAASLKEAVRELTFLERFGDDIDNSLDALDQ